MGEALSTLRLRARQRADMVNSQFVTDAEFNTYLNEGISDLYEMLVKAYGEDYFVSSATFSTVAGTSEYAIGSGLAINITDFYKLKGVDVTFATNEVRALKKFRFQDRNKYQVSRPWVGYRDVCYRLQGSKLWLLPAPNGVYSVKMWYVPKFVPLVNDVDEFDGINGWEKLPVAEAARKALAKEESDTSVLDADIARWKGEIEEMANQRDIGEEERAVDVYDESEYDDLLPEGW